MSRSSRPSLSLLAASLAAAGLLAACGGSDDPVMTTVQGSVVKGPVSGANVCAFKAVAAGKGDQLACVLSSAAGAYSMQLTHSGDVVIEASGGTYTDEATNTTKPLASPMQVVLSANGGTATGVVTPLTSVAYTLAKSATGGVTSVTFGTSAASVGTMFQLGNVNIATTLPVVTTGTTDAYGRLVRAVAQYIANGGTQANFQAFANPSTFQAAFNTAFGQINGTSANFSLIAPAPAPTPAPTPAPSPAPTPAPSPAPAPTPAPSPAPAPTPAPSPAPAPSSGTLTITVVAAGITAPATTIQNFPRPTSSAEFCGGITSSSQLNVFTASGGTLTINSCSFSGNVGTVNATVAISVQGFSQTIPYTATYTFN